MSQGVGSQLPRPLVQLLRLKGKSSSVQLGELLLLIDLLDSSTDLLNYSLDFRSFSTPPCTSLTTCSSPPLTFSSSFSPLHYLVYSFLDLRMADSPSSSSSSRCSKRVQQVVVVLLVLWSVVSLVVIVVWCTSPDLKGSAHCRAQLAQTTENQQAAQERWSKDKEALEEKLQEQHQETLQRGLEVLMLQVQLNQTKDDLQELQQENVSEEKQEEKKLLQWQEVLPFLRENVGAMITFCPD